MKAATEDRVLVLRQIEATLNELATALSRRGRRTFTLYTLPGGAWRASLLTASRPTKSAVADSPLKAIQQLLEEVQS